MGPYILKFYIRKSSLFIIFDKDLVTQLNLFRKVKTTSSTGKHHKLTFASNKAFVVLFVLAEMTLFYWNKLILTNISFYLHWVGILLITSSQVFLTVQQWENKNNTIWCLVLKVSYKQIGKKNLWKTCLSYPTSTPTKHVTKLLKKVQKPIYKFIQSWW